MTLKVTGPYHPDIRPLAAKIDLLATANGTFRCCIHCTQALHLLCIRCIQALHPLHPLIRCTFFLNGVISHTYLFNSNHEPPATSYCTWCFSSNSTRSCTIYPDTRCFSSGWTLFRRRWLGTSNPWESPIRPCLSARHPHQHDLFQKNYPYNTAISTYQPLVRQFCISIQTKSWNFNYRTNCILRKSVTHWFAFYSCSNPKVTQAISFSQY